MIIFSLTGFAQSGQKWATEGNSVSAGDFLGTTNNYPLLFKANNNLVLSFKTNGDVLIHPFAGNDSGLVAYNSAGKLIPFKIPNNDKYVLLGNGTWGPLPIPNNYWKLDNTNNHLYTLTTGNVGIGTQTPVMKLDVNGDAIVRGYLYVDNGVIIGKRIESKSVDSDTLRVNEIVNTKELFSKQMYSDTLSTIKVETENMNASKAASIGGKIFIDGASSSIYSGTNVINFQNTDIKTTGTMTANNLVISNEFQTTKMVTLRITSPDSIISFGDSTIKYHTVLNRIFADQSSGQPYKGIGIGIATHAKGKNAVAIGQSSVFGDYSVAIGNYVQIDNGTSNSVIIGSGYNSNNLLTNNAISNSLMVGFNSNLPTLIVTPASGPGFTGNVGIGTGTSLPQAKLHVSGAPNNTATLIVGNNPDANEGLAFLNTCTQAHDWIRGEICTGYKATSSGWEVTSQFDYSGIRFTGNGISFIAGPGVVGNTNLQTVLVIKENGNVGIGSETPNAKLQINMQNINDLAFAIRNQSETDDNIKIFANGEIWARRIWVRQGNWPDFVFNKNYELLSIYEVKDFIVKNNRLPDMPSESEIIKNGLDLGDMNSLLLKKIEELTLYIIKQQEEIDSIKKRIME